MENVNKTNTTSNETRSAVEIWRDFVSAIRDEHKKPRNEDFDDQFMIFATGLERATKQYIRYCFESASHRRLSKDICYLYFVAVFNDTFTEFLTGGDSLAAKIRNKDMSVIDSNELENIYCKMYDTIEQTMSIQKGTLSMIVINKMEEIEFYHDYETDKYKYLKIFERYCKKEMEIAKGRCCSANLIGDMTKYLSITSFKNNDAEFASYNCEIGAKNIINDMLACVFFKDEKYLDSATTVRLISASSSKDKLELNDALITSVAKDVYEALESYINEEPGTLMNIV